MVQVLIMMVPFDKAQKNRNDNDDTKCENDKPDKFGENIDI
jgi:hypothetical protein